MTFRRWMILSVVLSWSVGFLMMSGTTAKALATDNFVELMTAIVELARVMLDAFLGTL